MKLSTDNINNTIKSILFLFICAGMSFYCISLIYNILEYPYFFFSDQHEQVFKMIIPEVPILKHYPSRFDILTGIEFFPIVRSSWTIQHIMSAFYYIQSFKILVFFIAMLYIMSLLSNKTISFLLFSIFIFFGETTVDLLSTLSHTIFPDTTLAFLIVLFFIFYLFALKKDSTLLYLFSILCACILTYMKEPSFIIFLPLIFFNGFLNWKNNTKKEKIFNILLFLNCIIFIIMYIMYAYSPGSNYASGRSPFTFFENIKYVLSFSYYITLNIIILLIKSIYYIKIKCKFIKIYDIILLSSLGYTFAFFILNLNAKYYFLPSYALSFIAYSGYVYDIVFKYNSKKFLQELYQYLLFTLSIIFIIINLLNISKFDIQLHTDLKIITRPYSLFMVELEKNNIPVKSFLRTIDSYKRQHFRDISYWHYFTTKVFYSLYSLPKDRRNIYKTENEIVKNINKDIIKTKNELFNSMDNGAIVQLSPIEISTVSQWNNENYRIIDGYFTKFIYNKKYESDIHDAYCRFIERVFKNSKQNIRPKFDILYEQAQERQCIMQK